MNADRNPIYSIFMLILSLYVLVVLFLDAFYVKDPEVKQIFQYIDLGICTVFMWDFLWGLYRAENKRDYMRWGWLDCLSSIPAIDPLRWTRVSRIVRILRFLRTIKSARILVLAIQKSKFQSFTLIVFLIAFLAYTICASMILEYERGLGSPINTAEDALWWAFLNIMNAKVNIGQAQSDVGVIFTVVLNKVGLLLFAYFNAIVVAWLISKRIYKGHIQELQD